MDNKLINIENTVENDGLFTVRPLNTESETNSGLLEDFQQVDNIPQIPIEYDSCFDLNNLPKITSLSELLKYLCELMIRFDSNPKNYQKGDYEHLVKTITNSLIYLYTHSNGNTSTLFGNDIIYWIAKLTTNPLIDAIENNQEIPGIYLLDAPGVYENFNLTVTDKDLKHSILFANPIIINGVFDHYEIIRYEIQGIIDIADLKQSFNYGYAWTNYLLRKDGTVSPINPIDGVSFIVKKFNIHNKDTISINGFSLDLGETDETYNREWCLAVILDKNNNVLGSYDIRTGNTYTKHLITYIQRLHNWEVEYILIQGTSETPPSIEDSWIFYTTEEVDALLEDKANITHIHDDRYYTEGEVDGLLANFNTEVSHDPTLQGNGKPDELLGINEAGLNELNKYFVSAAEKFQIGVNNNNILDLQNLWSNYARLQNTYKGFTGTIMNLEKDIAYYTMTLSNNSTITFNTSLLDAGKIWAFDVYIQTTNYISVAFPSNVYFYGGNQMTDIGTYHYHFESQDNGLTWNANLVSKKINYIAKNGKIIFVKKAADGGDNNNDGLSWMTAKADIELAQSIAIAGDIILVKEGTYIPTQYRAAGVERSRSFVMKNGVNIYGGCIGTENNPDERIITTTTQTMHLPYGTYQFDVKYPTYSTILSGDLTNSNILEIPENSYGCHYTIASMSNNSYCVIYSDVTSLTILDGVSVTRAFSNSSGENTGTAVRDSSGWLRINKCEIYDNFSTGSFVKGGLFSNSKIEANTGTMYLTTIFDSLIINSTPYTNIIYLFQTSNLNHCKIYSCRGSNGVNSSAYNCTVDSSGVNSSIGYNGYTFVNLLISNCTNNSPSVNCNILGVNSNTSKVINIIVINCSATYSSGVIHKISNGVTISNVLYAHNYAPGGVVLGTGVTGYIASNLSIVNNLGVSHSGVIDVDLINSVVWNNKIDGLKANWYDSTGTHTASYCAFEDEVVAGTANIVISTNNEGDANSPKFKLVSATAGNTTDDFDYDINNGSFLIDKGNNSYPNNGDGSLYDCKGRTRKVDTVDIGCYENQKL